MESYSEQKVQAFNLGKASARDNVVWACHQPGWIRPDAATPRTPRKGQVPDSAVDAWLEAVKARGVRRVLCLLTDEELSFFESDLLERYANSLQPGGKAAVAELYQGMFRGGRGSAVRAVTAGGGAEAKQAAGGDVAETSGRRCVTHVPNLHAEGARRRVIGALTAAFDRGERIAVHCSSGQARSGTVSALWLAHTYGLDIDAAVAEVTRSARDQRCIRRPDASLLLKLLVGPRNFGTTARSLLAAAGEAAKAAPAAGAAMEKEKRGKRDNKTKAKVRPGEETEVEGEGERGGRRSQLLPVVFLQMGGTIDKEYPRSIGGYAFEIGDGCPGARSVLSSCRLCGVAPSFQTICRKDSQDVVTGDRQALLKAVLSLPGRYAVVTHGTDTMIRTARFVAAGLRGAKGTVPGAESKVVVFTGAMVPEAMKDSDAALNIGAALGCIGTMRLIASSSPSPSTSLKIPGPNKECSGGVFVAMGGRVFRAEECERDEDTHRFVSATVG